MSALTEKEIEKVQNLQREVVLALGNCNEIDKTTSRLRNELAEMNRDLSEKLKDNGKVPRQH